MTLRAFVSHSNKDNTQLDSLLDCLAPLVREKSIEIQRDYKSRGGSWISQGSIETADLAILLLSPSYLGSDACMAELDYALENRDVDRPVVAVLLRPCEYHRHLPPDIRPLPKGEPLSSVGDVHWAWHTIYLEIKRLAAKFLATPGLAAGRNLEVLHRLRERYEERLAYIKARIDGEAAEYFKADGPCQGAVVPSGEFRLVSKLDSPEADGCQKWAGYDRKRHEHLTVWALKGTQHTTDLAKLRGLSHPVLTNVRYVARFDNLSRPTAVRDGSQEGDNKRGSPSCTFIATDVEERCGSPAGLRALPELVSLALLLCHGVESLHLAGVTHGRIDLEHIVCSDGTTRLSLNPIFPRTGVAPEKCKDIRDLRQLLITLLEESGYPGVNAALRDRNTELAPQSARDLAKSIRERLGSALPQVATVLLPEGTFDMGAHDPSAPSALQALPRRRTKVSAFRLARDPVTRELYEAVMGSAIPSGRGGPTSKSSPMTRVSYSDAINFCQRLSILHDLQPCYDVTPQTITRRQGGNGYRLPTEAEWEYAARFDGGDHAYPWGNETEERNAKLLACFGHSNPEAGPCPLDDEGKDWPHSPSKAQNSKDFRALVGGVWEWCEDRCNDYRSEPEMSHNPVEDEPRRGERGKRMLRGGCWSSDMEQLQAFFRAREHEGARDPDIGFRVVLGGWSWSDL